MTTITEKSVNLDSGSYAACLENSRAALIPYMEELRNQLAGNDLSPKEREACNKRLQRLQRLQQNLDRPGSFLEWFATADSAVADIELEISPRLIEERKMNFE